MSGNEPKLVATKKKILIVDDQREYTDLLRSALEFHQNYEVCVENDPLMAVATALNFVPKIVIMDVVMPYADGGEVHTLFKAEPLLKDIPIIFLTSIVEQSEVDDRNGIIGGSPYLAKPVSVNRLLSAIAQHIGP